jgi:hypothetical protein
MERIQRTNSGFLEDLARSTTESLISTWADALVITSSE